jgi:thiol-disulfide isomerase/thioredoxin
MTQPSAAAANPKYSRVLFLGAAIIVALLAFRKPLQHRIVLSGQLDSISPQPELIRELVAESHNPQDTILKFWTKPEIPHRYATIQFLKDSSFVNSVQEIPVQGAHDPDSSVREMAFGILTRLQHPRRIDLATTLLADADDQSRLMGLQILKRTDNPDHIPVIGNLVRDQDPKVATSAMKALGRLTGLDFGARIADSIQGYEDGIRTRLTPNQTKRISISREKWTEWLSENYATPPPIPTSTPPIGYSAPDFELRDLAGKSVKRSDFEGRNVILNFWTTWCATCLSDVPDLIELQKRHPEDLVILGIALDSLENDHGHSHDTGEFSDLAHLEEDLNKIKIKVERVIRKTKMNYPVLLDPENKVGIRFNGNELPTHVLIDSSGMLRRRFVGGRSVATWERMLAEVSN